MSTGLRPTILIVRDGWGRNPNPEHDAFNAVKLAATPNGDALLRRYPWTLIRTSGEGVGLPEGTMGNSEVGHQNLGAGRIVDQDSVRITRAIRSGEFFERVALVEAVAGCVQARRPLHLLAIGSDAGVHGLLGHLYACLELCRRQGVDAAIHLITDGRDTGPFTGIDSVRQIEDRCAQLGAGRIVDICGRYYAMDRDNRWERVRIAHELLVGRGDATPSYPSAVEAMQDYYDQPTAANQRGDEFITPRTVGNGRDSRIRDGDSVIFCNFRGDRPRELTRAFVMPRFLGDVAPSPATGERGFDRGPKLDLRYVTMTSYDESLEPWVKVAFPKPPRMADIAGACLEAQNLRQMRCAETEKFPHVTFFFNDYRETPFNGESRQMAQSPSVATYDLKPEMSADQVTQAVRQRLGADDCEEFILVNFANGDMVGHTGNLEAAIKAVETVDQCVGSIVGTAGERGCGLVVTADHGNAEQMWDPDIDGPHTAHTTYDVECIVVHRRYQHLASGDMSAVSGGLRRDGRLADVMPTVFEMMGLNKPEAMTGESLLKV